MIPVYVLYHGLRLIEIAIALIIRGIQVSHISIAAATNSCDILIVNSALIQSLSLLALGISLSTLSTLNFSLGFFVGVLCAPLTFVRPLSTYKHHPRLRLFLSFGIMQVFSPLNWLYLISQLEFRSSVSDVVHLYLFAWKVGGTWTPFVWWCIWWPAWLVGLVTLASPSQDNDINVK
jgi:GPI-anchor transamidase subunit GAA1